MYTRLIILSACLTLSPSVFADVADDCIADFQNMKDLYDTSSTDSELECVRVGSSLSYFATATPPSVCDGEDEWHLDAKAIGGKAGKCSLQLHGSAGAACGSDRITYELKANEAAAWRKFLDGQCDQ